MLLFFLHFPKQCFTFFLLVHWFLPETLVLHLAEWLDVTCWQWNCRHGSIAAMCCGNPAQLVVFPQTCNPAGQQKMWMAEQRACLRNHHAAVGSGHAAKWELDFSVHHFFKRQHGHSFCLIKSVQR